MADAIRSGIAPTANMGSLPGASPSSSSNCDIDKVHEDAERLIRTLVWIRARLGDAETMEITDDFVRLWLMELQGVAYDAEDVLDDFLYEAMRLGLMNNGGLTPRSHMEGVIDAVVRMGKKVNVQNRIWVGEIELQVSSSISSTISNEIFAFLNGVEQRMKKINSRFDEIKERNRALSLDDNYGRRRVETPARQPTSSLMEEPGIFGREEDLERVKNFLLSDEQSSRSNTILPVMAIVGMGGLGKTTLAQLAYNDDAVNTRFPLKSWVCVSEGFDLVRLTKAMVESFNRNTCGISELDLLQVNLREKLAGRRFLLVLDDIWEGQNLSNCWDRLIAPLRYGPAESKIIITTRSEKVSKISRAISTYHLPCLEDGACLKLFSQRAFEGRNANSYQNLMAIGRKISNRCRGLPLLAKTLGGLLRCEDDEQTWNEISESNIWDIGEEKKIMDILALSYQHLPAHLKRCFRYCSVFPKDFEFDKGRLVQMWMAHGYIQSKGRKLMEDIGKECFDDLLYRSFFQHSQKPQIFLMHDLIHDLARCVSQGECYSVEDDKHYDIPGQVRHFSIVSNRNPESVIPSRDISVSGTVRSFLFMRISSHWDFHIMQNLIYDLFTRMKNLRLLDLRYTGLTKLPDSIGCLKHLRYLGLRGNPIKHLPESVGSLYHIQTLDLQLCTSFIGFPVSISNMFNLRHLVHEKDSFTYPVGLRKLTNLQSMPGFRVTRNYDRAKLGELKDINSIRSLVIDDITSLTDVEEAKKACLEKKERLWALDLRWDEYWTRPLPIDDEVLESLKPSLKLELLKISAFLGRSIPSWLGHPSFSKLACVELFGCRYWTSLPPLGQLPSLKWLSISSASSVEYIGDVFFSGGFPQLETLQLMCMHNWKSWCGARKGECPRLRELFVDSCYSLASLSIKNLDALESLKISACGQLHFSSEDQLPSTLQVLRIHGCRFLTKWCQQYRQRLVHVGRLSVQGIDEQVVLLNVLTVQEVTDACLQAQKRLRTLELAWDCNDDKGCFTDVGPEVVLENLRPHSNLHKLVIRGYTGSRFASWLGDSSFNNLVYVTLLGCSRCTLLPPLGQLPSLMELYVGGTRLLRCIGDEFFNVGYNTIGRRAFPSLQKLEFSDMPNWEKWAEMQDGSLSCLSELVLQHCPTLKALPRLPPTLREVEVANCDVITFPHSFDHLSSLHTLTISQLPILQKLLDLPLGLMKLTIQGLPALADLVAPPSLRDLVLEDCSESMVGVSLPHLTHLTSLRISNFPKLIRLPLHNLVILRELHICNCPELMLLECFSFLEAWIEYTEGLQALKSLESLSICDCPKLHLSANERPPSSLKSMYITNCPSLAAWHDKHWRNHIEVKR